jgi:hypothetical protein
VNSSELLQGRQKFVSSVLTIKIFKRVVLRLEEIELLVFWAEMRLSYQSLQETHQLQGGPVILYLKICQFPLLKSLQKKKNPIYKKSRTETHPSKVQGK